jgi:hypothetical protein
MDSLRKDSKASSMTEVTPPKRGGKRGLGWLLLLVVVVIAVGWAWNNGWFSSGEGYQAVFLDNNQVYFGKLSNWGSSFVVLKDVFYLQINQRLQPVTEGQPQPQFILTKLGNQEIHGPTDVMKINKAHILFVENLKDESQVVQGIAQFKAQQ